MPPSCSFLLSSLLSAAARILCSIHQMGSYLLWSSRRCSSVAEKLFFDALMHAMLIIQYRKGNLLPSMMVPLLSVVLKRQALHSYCHLSCFQQWVVFVHFLQITPCSSRKALKAVFAFRSVVYRLHKSSNSIVVVSTKLGFTKAAYLRCGIIFMVYACMVASILIKLFVADLVNICNKISFRYNNLLVQGLMHECKTLAPNMKLYFTYYSRVTAFASLKLLTLIGDPSIIESTALIK